MESSSEPSKEIMSGDDYGPKVGPTEIPARPRSLSKMERLLLRKQALKVKKRPVLATGIMIFLSLLCHYVPHWLQMPCKSDYPNA